MPAKIGAVDPSLIELAEAYGIAIEYWDWQGQHVQVTPATIAGVLAGLGVDASTPEKAWQAVRRAPA